MISNIAINVRCLRISDQHAQRPSMMPHQEAAACGLGGRSMNRSAIALFRSNCTPDWPRWEHRLGLCPAGSDKIFKKALRYLESIKT